MSETRKPFLILQLRDGDIEADDEFTAFLRYGGLTNDLVRRVRMEQEGLPSVDLDEYAGVLVGGGPWNVSDTTEKKDTQQMSVEDALGTLLSDIVSRDFPYLGMCYGLGMLGKQQGCVVSKERYGEEAGPVTIHLTEAGKQDPLLVGLDDSFRAFCGHKEACQSVPEGAVLLAYSDACPVQMIRVKQNVYAVQFHTELDITGIEVRVNAYKHHGYFDPDSAAELIECCGKETITEPMKILRHFVERYTR